MRKGILYFGILLGMLVAPKAAMAAHIDATTRNQSASSETVLIAEGGAAKLPIVISATAGKDTKARANELASYLERITGAKFEVKTGAAGPGILMGTIAEFPTPSAAEGLKIYDVYDGRDAFAIRTEGGCVKLLGATELGVSHAMSRFLTFFGCRWFFPGPTWEVIPKAAKLTFNINETDRPETLGASFGDDMGKHYEKTDPDAGAATKLWFRMNRVPRGFKSTAGHCAHNVVQRFMKEFEAHPEMRALMKDENGKLLRTGTGPESPPNNLKPGSKSWGMWGQLCVTNPETQKLVIRWAEERLDQYPDADMVGCGPDDGGDWCLCPECAKLGNPGNQAFYLANVVAKAIQKSHPGKLAGLLAYNYHCDPPDFPMEPNVYVELATSLLINSKYGFEKLSELWPTKVKYFGIYDYWGVYDWTRDDLPSGRIGSTRYVAETVAGHVKHGTCCMDAEQGNSWGPQGIGMYLAARVLWNSSANLEAAKQEFYDKAFGPASKEMKAYYDLIDMGNGPLVGRAFYRTCLDDLEAAEKAAADNPDVLARIAQLKQYNIYVYLLHKDRDTSLKRDERKNWALETLQWNYRIRNTYMTYWFFFTAFTSKQWANEFNEPTWNWWETYTEKHHPELIPYRDPKPITAEETGQWFQKMKAEYGEAPKVTDLSFSKRLVAPEWTSKEPFSGPSGVARHGAGVLALASLKGEPLRFTLTQAVMYADNSTGSYILENMEGKEIARGDTHKGENKLELKVPAAGVYYFKYDDHAGGWCFTYEKGLRAAQPLERGKGYTTSGDLWSWFYVPKGTAEIHFYASGCGGGALGIRDPNGRWIESNGSPQAKPTSVGYFFKTDGSYYSSPVPAGTDGAMWTLNGSPGSIHFFNIPTILSLTPDTLIVPEEVAKKDGLKY